MKLLFGKSLLLLWIDELERLMDTYRFILLFCFFFWVTLLDYKHLILRSHTLLNPKRDFITFSRANNYFIFFSEFWHFSFIKSGCLPSETDFIPFLELSLFHEHCCYF